MSYYGAPGSYGPPGGAPGAYGGYGQSGPPGIGGPPGMNQSQHPLPARPGGMPQNFQRPANMPNFDMNASVIRLGTGGPQKNDSFGGRGGNAEPLGQRRAGLGATPNLESQRQQIRETMMALQPPKQDEILKTIFVANITEGCGGDRGVEDILRSAGSLRRWTRAIDADNKPCTFGFAEFDDSESLETAAEILKDVQVPVKKQVPKDPTTQENGSPKENGGNGEANGEIETAKLLVVVDEASKDYAENWREQRGDSEEQVQFRLDNAKDRLDAVLRRLFHPTHAEDNEGDIVMQEQTQDPLTGEVITIPIAQAEDELSDIPAEMRETVAAEIAAFRDRSNRRDMERLNREEEIKASQRTRRNSIPTGPGGGGANSIPVGPRGMQSAPTGPRNLRGVQIPKDYQNGVSFVNGSDELAAYLGKDDDDEELDDEELEERRRQKKKDEQEKEYNDYERRWLNRERSRAAALDRERNKDETAAKVAEERKETMAKQMKTWNDDVEADRRKHEYYYDRSQWSKHRSGFRNREAQADAQDRRAEDDERRREQSANDQARGMADAFLNQQAEELGARGIGSSVPSFKIGLGAAAAKAKEQAEPKKRNAQDVEHLLDVDELEAAADDRRILRPIKFDTAAEAAALSPEEKKEAMKQLAVTIPQDKEGLFEWDVKWGALQKPAVEEQLRSFVEKRSMDYFGVVEEMMWDVVKETLKNRKGPDGLIDELEGLLEDETEGFVRKLWRMVAFYSEAEARGLAQ